jgi:FKBP-type peptidyl-prolyl cis-trans isomerase 2
MTIDEATRRGLEPGMHVILHLHGGQDADGVITRVTPTTITLDERREFEVGEVDTLELIVVPPAGLE